MRKLFLLLAILIGFCNCHSNAGKKQDAVDKANVDSIPDFETQSQERERIKAGYGITKQLDTTINIQGQSLHLFVRYYCLTFHDAL